MSEFVFRQVRRRPLRGMHFHVFEAVPQDGDYCPNREFTALAEAVNWCLQQFGAEMAVLGPHLPHTPRWFQSTHYVYIAEDQDAMLFRLTWS